MQDLNKINLKMNKTVIVNLHSVPLAKEFSTRIIALKYGEIIFDGPPEELTPTRLDTIYGSSQDRGSL
jgi:phosphonate transport system ATP-binding protein